MEILASTAGAVEPGSLPWTTLWVICNFLSACLLRVLGNNLGEAKIPNHKDVHFISLREPTDNLNVPQMFWGLILKHFYGMFGRGKIKLLRWCRNTKCSQYFEIIQSNTNAMVMTAYKYLN